MDGRKASFWNLLPADCRIDAETSRGPFQIPLSHHKQAYDSALCIQQGVLYNSRNDNTSNYFGQNARVGLDYSPWRNHTFGVLLQGNLYQNQGSGETTTLISLQNDGQIDQKLFAFNESDGDNSNYSGNLNYRFADTSGHEFTVDFDLFFR